MLNIRLNAHIHHLLRGHIYGLFSLQGSDFGWIRKFNQTQGLFEKEIIIFGWIGEQNQTVARRFKEAI